MIVRTAFVIFMTWVIGAERCGKESNLARILQNNGWNYVMVVHAGPITQMCQCLVQEFMKRQVYVRSVASRNLEITHDSMSHYLFILNALPEYDHLEPLIAATKPQKSALILNIPSETEEDLLIRIKVQDLYFYLCSQRRHWRIRSVISTPRFSHPVITEVVLDPGLRFIEVYDLQGQTLTEITVSHRPYMFEENGQARGLFLDLFGTLENKYNFSVSHIFESDWGVTPIQGTFENGTFGGTMGGVINGAFDLSLSSWLAAPERGPLLDMEPHPFSIDAWYGILLVAFLICATIIPPSLILGNYENTDAYNLASLSAWSFFLLINSFYGGALTMFFSTKAVPPFTGFREIVQAYPNWILKTTVGTDIYFYDRAESGDPDFKAFYERMVENPEETTFTDIAHVLKEMDTNYIGIMSSAHSLQYAFETNLDLTTPLEILETLNEAWFWA
eukprot:TCALIF_06495-PA protein Name:"Protein of unknown function" AED:0.58 eAED:0.58 QI:0/0/0.33/0.33/1/1/3/139/446